MVGRLGFLKALMSWKRRGTAEDTRLFTLARKREGARSLGQQEDVMVGAAVLEGGFCTNPSQD